MWNHATLTALAVFLMVSLIIAALGFFLFLNAYGDRRKIITRLQNLSTESGERSPERRGESREPPTMALSSPLLALRSLPALVIREEERSGLRSQLLRAGYFGPSTLRIFMGAKLLSMVGLPLICAGLPLALGLLAPARVLLVGVAACALGMWLPNLWLRRQVMKRQRLFRLGLPDVLDMLVLCLESGVSLLPALQRVTEQLASVHPELGEEMIILQREIQLGLTPGTAMKKLAERCGLDEVRDLASAMLQSEGYGTSVSKALRTHADGYRQHRHQAAEELAQKAAVKMLFPMLLCIFPAIFVVLLGPAAFQMAKIFAR